MCVRPFQNFLAVQKIDIGLEKLESHPPINNTPVYPWNMHLTIGLSFILFVHSTVCLLTGLSDSHYVCLIVGSVYQSATLSVNYFIFLSVCLPTVGSVHRSVNLLVKYFVLSVSQSIDLPVFILSIGPSFYLFPCLYIFLSVCIQDEQTEKRMAKLRSYKEFEKLPK